MSMNHQIASDSQAKPNVVSPRSSVCFPPAALATIGRLRALAVLLCLDADLADELVAVTLTRASVAMNPRHFELNISTWLYGRLRGYYYRDYARLAARREPQADTAFAALAELSAAQREALVLIEAAGCSFGEAARICRCPRDRFKQLVHSARATLARTLPARRFDAPKQPATIVALFASAQSMA
jgi:RNA polymerase sigma-70 factor, ECF subfamily